MPGANVVCKGQAERIGLANTVIHYSTKELSITETCNLSSHKEGLHKITEMLMDTEKGVISHPDDVKIIGHRVVHGGSTYDRPRKVDKAVLKAIDRLSSLAPLHNPTNATGIKVASEIFKNAVQVAVFDTAFHQTLPEKAYRYAIPKSLADDHQIRVYGFHGTSHKYVADEAMAYLEKAKCKLVTVHLGNGCSITAIEDGRSVDHSLGFGPSNGLIMGTRSGDIDQSVIFYLMDTLDLSSKEVNQMLQKQSGLLGLTGYSDLRDIQTEAEKGNKDCQLALVMMAYRIKKYIGSYIAALNGLDALIFTAGIGENSGMLRAMVCEDMEALGIKIDKVRNGEKSDGIREIGAENAKVKILVVPTNEELEIAKQSYELVVNSRG